jgi:hypothetical protein
LLSSTRQPISSHSLLSPAPYDKSPAPGYMRR